MSNPSADETEFIHLIKKVFSIFFLRLCRLCNIKYLLVSCKYRILTNILLYATALQIWIYQFESLKQYSLYQSLTANMHLYLVSDITCMHLGSIIQAYMCVKMVLMYVQLRKIYVIIEYPESRFNNVMSFSGTTDSQNTYSAWISKTSIMRWFRGQGDLSYMEGMLERRISKHFPEV